MLHSSKRKEISTINGKKQQKFFDEGLTPLVFCLLFTVPRVSLRKNIAWIGIKSYRKLLTDT